MSKKQTYKIKQLIASGDTKEALTMLTHLTKKTSTRLYNACILLSNRLSRVEREKGLQIIQEPEARINQIVYSTIQLADDYLKKKRINFNWAS